MSIYTDKINTYSEDLERVQKQIQELQQIEQRLTGAILALQDLQKEEPPIKKEESVEAVSGDVVD